MFTSPVDLDLFNLSTVFEACDVGQGILAISKLLALKKFGPFLQSTYYWMSCSTFLGGGAPCHYISKTVRMRYHHREFYPTGVNFAIILMKKLLDKISKGGGFWFSLQFFLRFL